MNCIERYDTSNDESVDVALTNLLALGAIVCVLSVLALLVHPPKQELYIEIDLVSDVTQHLHLYIACCVFMGIGIGICASVFFQTFFSQRLK